MINQFLNLKIAVIGDVMLDHYIWGNADRLSPEAPVPVVHVQKDTWVLGGASNVAANLAALGVSVKLIGAAGTDQPSSQLKSLLNNQGIHCEDIICRSNRSTIVKSRLIVGRQQVCRIDREDDPGLYALEFDDKKINEIVDSVDAIIISDYAKGSLTQITIDKVISRAKRVNVITAVDPKPRRMLNFSGPTIMTPNRQEAFELAGVSDDKTRSKVEDVARIIIERYTPENLVITLGPDGMLIVRSHCDMEYVATAAIEVFDVSGAGDAVIATLTAGLAAKMNLKESVSLANRAAGIVVGKTGTAIVSACELFENLS